MGKYLHGDSVEESHGIATAERPWSKREKVHGTHRQAKADGETVAKWFTLRKTHGVAKDKTNPSWRKTRYLSMQIVRYTQVSVR